MLGEVVILFFPSFHSFSLPEKLEYIVTKYAEHSHDKWACDKVGIIIQPTVVRGVKITSPRTLKCSVQEIYLTRLSDRLAMARVFIIFEWPFPRDGGGPGNRWWQLLVQLFLSLKKMIDSGRAAVSLPLCISWSWCSSTCLCMFDINASCGARSFYSIFFLM